MTNCLFSHKQNAVLFDQKRRFAKIKRRSILLKWRFGLMISRILKINRLCCGSIGLVRSIERYTRNIRIRTSLFL